MGGFHCGKTERYSLKEVDKGIFDDLRRFVCIFQALKGPLRASKGPQWFSMDKLVCHEKSR